MRFNLVNIQINTHRGMFKRLSSHFMMSLRNYVKSNILFT